MLHRFKAALAGLAMTAGAACSVPNDPFATVSFAFDFKTGEHGCVAGFADYPPGQEGFLELVAARRPIPGPVQPPLVAGDTGFFLSGNNHTDDLFMFLACPVEGLRPDATYDADIGVEIATSVPRGCLGVGGSPGESVFLKAGAVAQQPGTVIQGGWYRTNFDKGNQAVGGEHMGVLGTIENSRGCELSALVWERKTFQNTLAPVAVQASGSRSAWILAGTDSGFEATTSIYITRINGQLKRR
jgi:hypothetical protein